MIKEKDIKEIRQHIILAASFLGCNDENTIAKLTDEVERQISLNLPKHEKRMRKYVEDAYNSAAFIYSTGRSMLFFKRHDRQPIELKFGFGATNTDWIMDWIRENNLKYMTKEEFDIIRERLKTDPSKKLCDTRCNGFWKSEKNADRYNMPVSFHGENPDYCDKSSCDCL